MADVSVRDLRNHGGDVLDAVAAGESVTVTRQGRPVARLVPVRALGTPRDDVLRRWKGLPSVDADRLRADIDALVDQSW